MLKLRIKFLSLSIICLVLGLAIYLFLRSDTYLHLYIPRCISDYQVPLQNNIAADFIKYYFVDFLWGIALSFGLISVSYSINRKSVVAISVFSLFCGVGFELLQLLDLCNGTFDLLDIGMYAAASIIFAVININTLKKEV